MAKAKKSTRKPGAVLAPVRPTCCPLTLELKQ